MRTSRVVVMLAVVLALPSPGAFAKDTVQDLLAQAKQKAKDGNPAPAAALFGDALALVQKQGDLVVEQEVSDDFMEFLVGLEPIPGAPGATSGTRGFGRNEVLATVLRKLDPKRCGAFVSAPCLAGELLLAGIQKGDDGFAADASAVLSANVRAGKAGLGITLLAKLALALQAAPTPEAAKVKDADLDQVMAAALQEDWIDLAMAAGIERAARAAARADGAEEAKAAVRKLVALVTPRNERRHCDWLALAARVRLKDAASDISKPLSDAYIALGGSSASGAGGRGGEGATSTNPVSPVGQALRKGVRGGPLGTAARTKEGFEFRVSWNPRFRGLHEHGTGVKNLDDGGLTVSFADWSVSLRMVDTVGNNGQPGEGSHPDSGRAFYRVAKGETWTLRSDGVVTVGR